MVYTVQNWWWVFWSLVIVQWQNSKTPTIQKGCCDGYSWTIINSVEPRVGQYQSLPGVQIVNQMHDPPKCSTRQDSHSLLYSHRQSQRLWALFSFSLLLIKLLPWISALTPTNKSGGSNAFFSNNLYACKLDTARGLEVWIPTCWSIWVDHQAFRGLDHSGSESFNYYVSVPASSLFVVVVVSILMCKQDWEKLEISLIELSKSVHLRSEWSCICKTKVEQTYSTTAEHKQSLSRSCQ